MHSPSRLLLDLVRTSELHRNSGYFERLLLGNSRISLGFFFLRIKFVLEVSVLTNLHKHGKLLCPNVTNILTSEARSWEHLLGRQRCEWNRSRSKSKFIFYRPCLMSVEDGTTHRAQWKGVQAKVWCRGNCQIRKIYLDFRSNVHNFKMTWAGKCPGLMLVTRPLKKIEKGEGGGPDVALSGGIPWVSHLCLGWHPRVPNWFKVILIGCLVYQKAPHWVTPGVGAVGRTVWGVMDTREESFCTWTWVQGWGRGHGISKMRV